VRLSTRHYTDGSLVQRVIHDTVRWLDFTYRCVRIVVNLWLSAIRMSMRSLLLKGEGLHEQQGYPRIVTHLSGAPSRYIRGPMVRIHKMKYSILIGSIPMLVAGIGSIACCHADTIVPVKVQSMTITRASSPETFVERWLPLGDMKKYVRVIPIVLTNEGDTRPSVAPANHRVDNSEQLERQDVAQVEHTTLPRSRPRNIRYLYKRDQRTCVRHNMRTVYYGKHRWRCRR